MSDKSFDDHPDIIECGRHIDRAIGGLSTLHLGPLDYNVSSAVDNLRAAEAYLHKFFSSRKEV